MRPAVLDASAAVELLRRTPAGRQVEEALRGNVVLVPGHFDAEVLSAVGRLVRVAGLAEEVGSAMVEHLRRAPFQRVAVPPLLAEAWSLRSNVALRDALYVALARRAGATLVTADARLARAPRLDVAVVVAG